MGIHATNSLSNTFLIILFLAGSNCDTDQPSHPLNFVGSQQSLYVHRALLNAYAGFRAQHAIISSFANPLLTPIGKEQFDLFEKGEPVGEEHFSSTELPLTAFIAGEHRPENTSGHLYTKFEILPTYFYHVVCIYNFRFGVTANVPANITIKPETLANIFAGTHKKWSDIAELSSIEKDPKPAGGVPDPDVISIVVIKPVHRVTEILTQYLYAVKSDWHTAPANADKPFISKGDEFPPKLKANYLQVESQDAVIGTIMNTPGSIGCVSWVNYKTSAVKAGVLLLDGLGPSKSALKSAITSETVTVALDNTKAIKTLMEATPKVYPLVGFSYILMRNSPTNGYDCTTAVELLRYYRWIHRDKKARQRIAADFDAVTTPNVTYDKIIKGLSYKLMCNDSAHPTGTPVWELMLKTMADEQDDDLAFIFGVYFLTPLVILLLTAYIIRMVVIMGIVSFRVRRGRYQIRSKNITFIVTSRERYKEMLKMRPYLDNHDLKGDFLTGEYGFCVVLLRPIYLSFNTATLEVREELVYMQDWKTHNNLAKFLGVTEIRQDRYVVSELSLLGDLRTLLSTKSVKLTSPISYFMARGVVNGMEYLHSQDMIHGNLRTTSIYVESDWTVKISDWEYVHLYRMQGIFVSKELVLKSMFKAPKNLQNIFFTPLLWSAPEILKATFDGKGQLPTKYSDCYSFAIVFYEIITRNMPFKFISESGDSPLSLLMRILHRKKPLCPLDLETTEAQNEIPESMQLMMRSCWSVDPKRRLKTDEIAVIFETVQAETKRMADLTIVNTDYLIDKQKSEIKNYNSDLKQRVLDLRKASEDFLTPTIYEKVRAKLPVEPAYTERAYVLHLTMVEYEDLLEVTHGESAIALIERFQILVSQFVIGLGDSNIFRLHTASDDCTIIGAVPTGEIDYADKMAVLALDLLAITWKAVMLDIDTDHIKIRLGLHCGPVISGLYGTDHTEFTVIGETRDIAEDMERLSGTYRILVSEEFIKDLNKFSGFSYIENTDDDRAHELTKTYWLLARDHYSEQAALDEIWAEYGNITDGRVPDRLKDKKLHPAVEFRQVPTERATARRASLAAHKAIKMETKEKPAILERRRSSGQPKNRRGSATPEVLQNLPATVTKAGMDEKATFDVVRLVNNQDLVVVDFSNDEDTVIPTMSTNLLRVQMSLESTLTVNDPQTEKIAKKVAEKEARLAKKAEKARKKAEKARAEGTLPPDGDDNESLEMSGGTVAAFLSKVADSMSIKTNKVEPAKEVKSDEMSDKALQEFLSKVDDTQSASDVSGVPTRNDLDVTASKPVIPEDPVAKAAAQAEAAAKRLERLRGRMKAASSARLDGPPDKAHHHEPSKDGPPEPAPSTLTLPLTSLVIPSISAVQQSPSKTVVVESIAPIAIPPIKEAPSVDIRSVPAAQAVSNQSLSDKRVLDKAKSTTSDGSIFIVAVPSTANPVKPAPSAVERLTPQSTPVKANVSESQPVKPPEPPKTQPSLATVPKVVAVSASGIVATPSKPPELAPSVVAPPKPTTSQSAPPLDRTVKPPAPSDAGRVEAQSVIPTGVVAEMTKTAEKKAAAAPTEVGTKSSARKSLGKSVPPAPFSPEPAKATPIPPKAVPPPAVPAGQLGKEGKPPVAASAPGSVAPAKPPIGTPGQPAAPVPTVPSSNAIISKSAVNLPEAPTEQKATTKPPENSVTPPPATAERPSVSPEPGGPKYSEPGLSALRLRRKAKRKRHNPSIHSHMGTNPLGLPLTQTADDEFDEDDEPDPAPSDPKKK